MLVIDNVPLMHHNKGKPDQKVIKSELAIA
jgi:hypothetical protein